MSKNQKGEVIMAVSKKVVTPVTAKAGAATVKAEAPRTEIKKTETATVKAEEPVKKAEPVKEAVKKAEPVKETVKKAEPAKKEKAAGKTPGRKPGTKKAELTGMMHIQFDGKSYSQDDLMKIAKDVWKYDLKQKAGDLTSVELYVKPEESMVYYVMNKEFTGSFLI